MNEDDFSNERNGRLTDFEEHIVEEGTSSIQVEIANQPEFYKIPKRFGTVPVDELPLGYVKGKGYLDKYPHIKLPFQKIEEIKFGENEESGNKIYWGDNLHIMRMLPSESIDLIYIDPPFFSGRNYMEIFGDENERRSFSDIWDGGMPTYLVWLNARLLEMKRLLKPTGSIYVHLDWHASHYVKVEMDKIFGYDNFQNEIIWRYKTGGSSKRNFAKKHDVLLLYSKTDDYFLNLPKEKAYTRSKSRKAGIVNYGGGYAEFFEDENGVYNLVNMSDVWDISYINSQAVERIGYPTQKPEALLERIIESSSNNGDVVADFFSGGGTTAAVAQKLNRKWITSDISRIAVEITKGRVIKAIREKIEETNANSVEVLSWGYYDIATLSQLPYEDFKTFILQAFGARRIQDPFISGLKSGIPVWIGPSNHDILIDEEPVLKFAEYLENNYENRKKGIMIGWHFSERAKQAQESLAKLGAGIDFVSIDLVPIGSTNFKKHITEKNQDYSNFLRFILPPVGRVRIKRMSELTYEFDFSESVSLNGGKIVNVQADFDYEGVFIASSGFAITGTKNINKPLILKTTFNEVGNVKVAFKIEDDQGGETLLVKEIEVN